MCAKKIELDFKLSESDIEAILCALPLVVEIGADTPLQSEINASLCESAGRKLISHSASLSANEVRVISASVTAAVLLLSGQSPEIFSDLDPSYKQELSRYLFTLNRLDPIFRSATDRFRNSR